MGRKVLESLEDSSFQDWSVKASPQRGEDMNGLFSCDGIIDFALPKAVESFLDLALTSPGGPLPPLVVASTGWNTDQKKKLKSYAERGPVVQSSNFSTGVLALQHILRRSSPLLEQLNYTPVIVETHHKHKLDSPSGTARSLQSAVAPAGPGNVQTHSIRAGEVIGDHKVIFYGQSEELEFRHFAQDRALFAQGALLALQWLIQQRKKDPQMAGYFTGAEFFEARISSS